MKKGDLVMPISSETYPSWENPGVIIKGPYGTVTPEQHRYDGKVILSTETKVVDVLLNERIFAKIPVENLKVLR